MVNMKKIIELSIEVYGDSTIGEMHSMYTLEDVVFKNQKGQIYDKAQEAFEELKRLRPIWKEKYGFDDNTKLSEVLKTMN